jgi:periplasmic divalent cation tolerance protein
MKPRRKLRGFFVCAISATLARMRDTSLCLLYSPLPSLAVAQSIARTLVDEKLAACCNILPGMHSIYRWEGVLQEEQETVLLVKTTAQAAQKAMERLAKLHPYEVPAIMQLPVTEASDAFGQWVVQSVIFPD